ncbi:uncharacterized protein LOC142224056 [Haematobia irritans]|uniref:uncharacterized protein LOC142224056 n=1 Tax=Haematobia irritans TaxID=7368 RepID=UPI003F4FC6D8
MNKSFIILVLALAVQVTLGAPRTAVHTSNVISPESGDVNSNQRFDFVEDVYENLQNTVWSKAIYEQASEYLQGVKSWSQSNEKLKESSIYGDLQKHLDNCLNLLKELSANPEDCKKQWSLKKEHDEIRQLFDSVDDAKLRRGWVEKYMNFVTPLRVEVTSAYEKFYSHLTSEVESYLSSANVSSKDELREWLGKFKRQTDHVKKQKLVMELLALFPNERQVLDAKCEVQYSNGL